MNASIAIRVLPIADPQNARIRLLKTARRREVTGA